MQDKDLEENYHARFMQKALTDAGFESKIFYSLDELRWDASGHNVTCFDYEVMISPLFRWPDLVFHFIQTSLSACF